tara:strand:- start:47 stop:496 length:450 start_codon:yes stop_codon:yes gene_type:complete
MQLKTKKGIKIKVDQEDYEYLKCFTWCIHNGYACTNVCSFGGRKTMYMHRLLLEPDSTMQVDHINGDRLDNRRENLRECTEKQNKQHKTVTRAKSGLRGVTKNRNKWISRIKFNGITRHIGSFNTKIEAAKAYDVMARKSFGEFAFTNF